MKRESYSMYLRRYGMHLLRHNDPMQIVSSRNTMGIRRAWLPAGHFRKYCRQMVFWQSVMQMKSSQVTAELADMLLSVTTETDLIVLHMFECPAAAIDSLSQLLMS